MLSIPHPPPAPERSYCWRLCNQQQLIMVHFAQHQAVYQLAQCQKKLIALFVVAAVPQPQITGQPF
jgi:hypothetical protein